MIIRFTTRESDEIIDRVVADLPGVIQMVVGTEDVEELLYISLGYHNRRKLSSSNLYLKLVTIASTKFSPSHSATVALRTVYDLLIALETFLELKYKVRLHYTTHYVEALENEFLIEEFPERLKPHEITRG